MVSQVKNVASLDCFATLPGESAANQPAEFPQERFHCLLDLQPDHLVPERYLRTAAGQTVPSLQLVVNPLCSFMRKGEVPARIMDFGLLDNFARQGEMLWVNDRATDALQPFWLGPRCSAALHNLHPGDSAPRSLSAELRSVLLIAGVLVEQGQDSMFGKAWSDASDRATVLFQLHGYTPVGRLIHPFHLAALRRYYRCLIRTGHLRLGDAQSSRRYIAHNESVARFFHHHLTPMVARVAGEEVKPSYVYVASYQGGASLEKHTDREQCEFSVSLCLDYSPEPSLQTPWPLQLHTKSGMVTVFQGIGDGLLYRGRELPHSRQPLPNGHTSTSIFFHYVRKDFRGPLD